MDIWTILGISLIVLLFLTGAPLAIAFATGSTIVALMVMGTPFSSISGWAFSSVNSFPILACPFFILAGTLLVRTGGMVAVRDFMNSWFGQWRGGLAVSAIAFGAFLGAVSGSTLACLAIMGTVMVPIMVDSGYNRSFSAGLLVGSAELGWLIPPSLGLIIFGAFTRVSISELFLSGLGIGILAAVFMAIIAIVLSRRRKYPASPKQGWRIRGTTFLRALPLLLMPVIVLGGIYGGIFSPTESAAVACLYTLLIGIFVYRKLGWKEIKDALLETAGLTALIYLLFAGADLFSKMVGFLGVPQAIADFFIGLGLGPLAFLLVIEGMLLVMGCFFSSIAMIIVVLPLFMPVVYQLGIDPVLYGILTVTVAAIGEITPPIGPQLWFAAPIMKVRMGAIAKEVLPFLGAFVLAVLVVTFFPDITMFLVRLWR